METGFDIGDQNSSTPNATIIFPVVVSDIPELKFARLDHGTILSMHWIKTPFHRTRAGLNEIMPVYSGAAMRNYPYDAIPLLSDKREDRDIHLLII